MEDGCHILVVDDHRDIRDPLAAYLKRHGFRVSAAADSRSARDVLLRNSVDLVVLDIMMPGEGRADALPRSARVLRHASDLLDGDG